MATDLRQQPWPAYLQSSLPPFLETVGYPFSGVSDLDSCRFSVGCSENGKWVCFVDSGWYYFNNVEQYHYILPGSQTVAASAGSGTTTQTISFRPSWGPVLLYSNTVSGLAYIQHANSFSPGNIVTWTQFGSTSLYYTTLATGAICCGLRDLTTFPLGSVAGTGAIISDKFYVYDPDARKVYIKPKDPSAITIYVDLIYTYPSLRMRELVSQQSGYITPSYKTPWGLANLRVFRGANTYSYSGLTTGTLLTTPVTGTYDGDWLVMEYDIPYSYTIFNDTTVKYYTHPVSGDNFTVYWESTVPDINTTFSLATNSTGIFNLNPLFADSYRTGYLFHSYPASSFNTYFTPSTLHLNLDKDTIIWDTNECVKMTLMLYGDNGLPLPNYPVGLTYTGTATAVVSHPSLTKTDGRGEMHALFLAASGAIFSISALASSTLVTLSATASSTVVSLASLVSRDVFNKGFVNLVTTDEKTAEGFYRSYVNITSLDGIPYKATATDTINVNSKLPSEFVVNYGSPNMKTATTSVQLPYIQNATNPTGIIEFGYSPQPQDIIQAISGTAQSTAQKED